MKALQYTRFESPEVLERLELGFLTGALTPPRIAARFPLSRAREAYEVVARGDPRGRVVLVPQ